MNNTKNIKTKTKETTKVVDFEAFVRIFWAIINPVIWRLGRKHKWVRDKYRRIRKGKYLWGIMGAIVDYESSDNAECKPDPEFEKYMKRIFEYKSPKQL